jgi:shikimate kinase
LQARLRKDPANLQRPSLTGEDAIAEVPTVLEQREPIYLKLADVIVSVDNRTPQETAAEVVRRMEA